jgi:ribosomal protein L22
VRSVTVDKGMTIVRFMPRAMGRATPINRECSHIRVELEKKEDTAIRLKTDVIKNKQAKVS